MRLATRLGMLAAVYALVFASGSDRDGDSKASELEGQSAALLVDSDGDGILDEDDNCVDTPNADQSDLEEDGVGDVCDNCLLRVNPGQDDCDGDFCGNLCDCDYDQSGTCGWPDWGVFSMSFGTTSECQQHQEPIGGGRPVGFGDFGFFAANFGSVPGPSGTTPGTVACPIWESPSEP